MDGERITLKDGGAITIRTLRLEDCARLAKIDAAITGHSRGLWFENKLKRTLSEADVGISVGAERDGLLIGAMMGTVRFGEFGVPEPVAVLDTALVDPAFAGQGVAKAMLEQLLANLKALRIARLRTEVAWNEIELIGFFGRSGFVPAPRLVLERDV